MKRTSTYFLMGWTLAGISGYGLYWLVINTKPFLKERWFMFLLLFIFVCGFTMPIYALLNRNFFAAHKIDPPVIIRESIGTALLVDIMLWFRIGRVLSKPIIFICIGGFLIFEIMMRAKDKLEYRSDLDDD